jgi:rare lipoprotein A
MGGLASVYANKFSGRKTASGQKFCQNELTAAHRSLPLGTKVLVTNIHNLMSVEVSINDRGPWPAGRVIDLSKAAAAKIGIKKTGNAVVKLEVVSATTEG